jgi:hypothetical protein
MDSLFKRVDEDEGSPLRGGVNRDNAIARENRKISGCPPSQPKLENFPSSLENLQQTCQATGRQNADSGD